MSILTLTTIFSKSWNVFKRNWVIYTAFALITFLLKYATSLPVGEGGFQFWFGFLVFLIGLIANYTAISAIIIYTLRILEHRPLSVLGSVQRLTPKKVVKVLGAFLVKGLVHMILFGIFVVALIVLAPTMFVGAGIIGDIIKFIILGVLLFPAVIMVARLAFVIPSILEGHTIRAAFRESWKISKGEVWFVWTNFFMMMLIMFIGCLCFIVGVLPAMAICMIMNVELYLALRDKYRATRSIK
ncbi:MAG TPA: glycerophosphoryl diester phosphodiesterase membrane domain-containing protein [Candidatus Paceibacterota bacterium]